ncbi:cytosolic carboxypeptidase 6-like [Anneissia japonica]|uniref:cytosolic carboxypeptidase 6-like n=1 Tax=Anneissia japonica TaxID=1529436 RepID=UPI0014257F38|nr:cytosolic carboxypeptidase 6-like [Anneissia japonica]
MADKKPDSAGSDSSSEDPVIGNLNKFAVVPPGYTARPRKGHLIFDACFECGNLGRVDYITDYEYDLFIRPDTCNPRFRVWFNFTVENVKQDQRVIFNIVNFSKTKSLYRDGMSPVVKSTSRPRWQRIPSKNVYYYKCPEHRKNYVMSFAFCFDRDEDTYQFSYSFPYSYTRLQTYLGAIEKRRLDYFQRELICFSVQQRRLDLLTITNPENLANASQHVVFITARVHPGESPASYVCQGLIDFLLSQHPIAKVLREHVVFKIVPMLNPDGVYLGNYRCSLMGFDLNRHWHEPSPWAHPTLHGTKNLLMQMDADTMNTSFNRDAMKAGTGRRFLGGILNKNTMCYTLEVSFFCYTLNQGSSIYPYDEDSYMKLGRNLAKTFLDYYKLTLLITPKATLVGQVQSKSSRPSKGHRVTDGRAHSEMRNYPKPGVVYDPSSFGSQSLNDMTLNYRLQNRDFKR